jgi:hypothetical protein
MRKIFSFLTRDTGISSAFVVINKRIICVYLIFIVVLILVTFIPYFVKLQGLSNRISAENKIFNHLRTQSKMLISEETFREMKEENSLLQQKLGRISSVFNSQAQTMPENTTDPAIFFRQNLYATQKKLRALAEQKGIFLVENLGFGQELPEANMVEIYMRQLTLIKELVNSLIKAGVFSINLISLTDLEAVTEGSILKLGAQINFDANEEALVSFSKEIKKEKPIIVIEQIQIEKLEDKDRLNITMLASSFIFK